MAAGKLDRAAALLAAMIRFAGDGDMLPEQVWDDADIPERELFRGRPTGSAMPLVWAHSEYIKLLRSLRDGQVFDMPPQTVRRYQVERVRPAVVTWRFNQRCRTAPHGRLLRVETSSPAGVRWTADDWATEAELPTRDTGLGMHIADLPVADLPPGSTVAFTFQWRDTDRWEGTDFHVEIVEADGA